MSLILPDPQAGLWALDIRVVSAAVDTPGCPFTCPRDTLDNAGAATFPCLSVVAAELLAPSVAGTHGIAHLQGTLFGCDSQGVWLLDMRMRVVKRIAVEGFPTAGAGYALCAVAAAEFDDDTRALLPTPPHPHSDSAFLFVAQEGVRVACVPACVAAPSWALPARLMLLAPFRVAAIAVDAQAGVMYLTDPDSHCLHAVDMRWQDESSLWQVRWWPRAYVLLIPLMFLFRVSPCPTVLVGWIGGSQWVPSTRLGACGCSGLAASRGSAVFRCGHRHAEADQPACIS